MKSSADHEVLCSLVLCSFGVNCYEEKLQLNLSETLVKLNHGCHKCFRSPFISFFDLKMKQH
jgi:hypothetical protein